MTLQPKKNIRKQLKGRNTGLASRGTHVSFGMYGLKSIGWGEVSASQIEAARRAISRFLKRGGKIWIRIFPDKPKTKKPLEVRQGQGKGSIEKWVALVQPGRVLFEIDGVSRTLATEAFRLASAKLSVGTIFCLAEHVAS
jgi:large subunit ribosomal protein L16